MHSLNREKQSYRQAFWFSHESLGRGLPWPLTPSCRPGNLWNLGAHGKPVEQSPSQIRLLTSRDKQVTEVPGWQLGEQRGLNNQSFWLDVIGRIGMGLKGQRLFSTWRLNGHPDILHTACGIFQGCRLPSCICVAERRNCVVSAEFQKWHLISGWF